MTREPLDLRATQHALADALRAPSPVEGGLAELIAAGNERLTPAMQLEIYREQFFLRHIDVLREDFGAVEHLLGDDAFESLARAYLGAHPPSSFTLRDLGAELPRFVATTEPWNDDAFVADLARVEWAFVEAAGAPDAPALDLESIAAIAEDVWPSARIVLSPSVRRLALGHAAHDYRRAARRTADAANLEALAGLMPPDPKPAHVVVYRGRETLEDIELETGAYALLDELARGVPLGDACERVAPRADDVTAWFRQWTALGWLSRVEIA